VGQVDDDVIRECGWSVGVELGSGWRWCGLCADISEDVMISQTLRSNY